jgi:hypothetical protein
MGEENLTEPELDCARHLMGRIGCRESVVEAGPEALVADWTAFVARCQKGFACERDAFLQDLSVRTILDRLFTRLPESIRFKLEPRVRAADYAYRAIPKKSLECVAGERLARRHPPERHFWLYGFPETVRLA